jgi:plastocyanin
MIFVASVLFACTAVPARGGEAIVVRRDAVEPSVLRATTGERVDFVNRTGRAVHVEFAGDVRGHQVVQLPATGPIWVVFHRPGTHPYVIHVYERPERTLRGTVEVTEDPQRPWDSSSCGVSVMGACLEP